MPDMTLSKSGAWDIGRRFYTAQALFSGLLPHLCDAESESEGAS